MPYVGNASPELAKAAAAGAHGHWRTFDEALECARFHLLQGMVSASSFDAEEAGMIAAELRSFSYSYGYGSEDSYLNDMEAMDPESEIAEAHRYIHDNPEDGDYHQSLDKSHGILVAACATDRARDFVNALLSDLNDAFDEGRTDRANKDKTDNNTTPQP